MSRSHALNRAQRHHLRHGFSCCSTSFPALQIVRSMASFCTWRRPVQGRPTFSINLSINPFKSTNLSGQVSGTQRRVEDAVGADRASLPATIPQLSAWDRILAGWMALLVRPTRLFRSAIVLKLSTLLVLHKAMSKRKYRMLFSPKRRQKPGTSRTECRTRPCGRRNEAT